MKKLLLLFSFSVLTFLSISGLTLRERIERLEKSAEQGDAEAMYHLATLYENGYDSIPSDSLKSITFLRRSAEMGYAPAQNYLGYKLYKVKPDSAIVWLSAAAEAGDLKAANNLAFLLLSPDSVADDSTRRDRDRRAVSLLEKGAGAGLPTAMATLADLYREGRGVDADTAAAERLYLDAVRGGLQDAERKLIAMNRLRYDTLAPYSALAEGLRAADSGADVVAFLLFSKSAEGGLAKAHTLLGDSFSSARGTDYNHSEAMRQYYLGAIGGDPSAQFILAELLEIFPDALSGVAGQDSFIPEEYSSPEYWYEKAAAQGVGTAKEASAMMRKLTSD